jgi:ribonuclease-3
LFFRFISKAIVDKILSKILFHQDKPLSDIWDNLPEYPLKIQYPNSDRHLIEQVPLLKKLTKFEEDIGVEFQHIRMLAQAFCTRPIPQNDLTIEDNERLEFLGKKKKRIYFFCKIINLSSR